MERSFGWVAITPKRTKRDRKDTEKDHNDTEKDRCIRVATRHAFCVIVPHSVNFPALRKYFMRDTICPAIRQFQYNSHIALIHIPHSNEKRNFSNAN